MNNKIFLKYFLALFFLFFPLAVSAVTPVNPNDLRPQIQIEIGGFAKDNFSYTKEYACKDGSGESCLDIGWLGEYISVIYQYGIGIAAILAVVMIMVGGFIWLISAGSPDKVGKAKEFITAALTGLMLALFSFIILNAINPRLVSLDSLEIKTVAQDNSEETISVVRGEKANDEKCSDDSECQSGLCITYMWNKCGDPNADGRSCKRDIECQSGICITRGGNMCIQPMSSGKGCDRDKECLSGKCITKGMNYCQ